MPVTLRCCCCFFGPLRLCRWPVFGCVGAPFWGFGGSVSGAAGFCLVFEMLSYLNYTQNHLFGGLLPPGGPHDCAHSCRYILLIFGTSELYTYPKMIIWPLLIVMSRTESCTMIVPCPELALAFGSELPSRIYVPCGYPPGAHIYRHMHSSVCVPVR